MTLSWEELVCHSLLVKVGDPSLVKDLMKVMMKERWLFLEEEAREFQSGFVYPVVGVYFSQGGSHPSIVQEFKIRVGYCKVARAAAALSPEMWLTAIRYKNIKKEFIYSWVERRPYIRRESIMTAFGGDMLAGQPATTASWRRIISGAERAYLDTIAKCQWYQGIHEGRYYLFWHKDSFRNTYRSAPGGTDLKIVIEATIDINVIKGRTRENRWTHPEYNLCTWRETYLSEGVKERKHIDDMFP